MLDWKLRHCTCLPDTSLTRLSTRRSSMMPTGTAQLVSKVPHVSQNDLVAFHEAHFSQDAVAHFAGTFVSPGSAAENTPPSEVWDPEDDGLGYYNDGVKRTLTDEQIEIFRHSELQQLRKAEEKKASRRDTPTLDEGELSESQEEQRRQASGAHDGPKRKKRKMNRPPREPKPDLRKRTWDVVEAGLDTLDYD